MFIEGAITICPFFHFKVFKRRRGLKTIETERLLLRQMTVGDAGFILELMNEPGWLEFIGNTTVKTLDDAENYISNRLASLVDGPGFAVVVLKETQVAIGVSSLIKRDYLPDVDIGYAFLAAYHQQGYAFEAAFAVLNHAQDVLGMKRIIAVTDLDNQRSAKLLDKLGLKFESTVIYPKDGSELNVFGINF